MKNSSLKNKYNDSRNYETLCLFKKQTNLCLTILRKTKKQYFGQLDMNEIPILK